MPIDMSGAKDARMLQVEGQKRETSLDEEMVSELLYQRFLWHIGWAELFVSFITS
jgi:hypothetical protein